MLSSMFPRLDYACYERGWITRYELTHLLRAMRRYNNAILNSDNHAVTKPRLGTKRVLPILLWSLFRLACENPFYFVAGLICALPAIGFLIYTYAPRLIRVAEVVFERLLSWLQ